MLRGTSMIYQRDNFFWFKVNSLIRHAYIFLPLTNLIVVNEYPKSGGTWLGLMLSFILDIPFPRNRFPLLNSKQIFHGHYLNLPVNNFNNKVIIVWRDGRDIVVSQYFFYFFESEEKKNKYLVSKMKKLFKDAYKRDDFENVKELMPLFIDFIYSQKAFPKFTWVDFVNRWANRSDVIHIKYEDLRINTYETLLDLIKNLDKNIDEHKIKEAVEQFSFEKMAKRKAGQEDKKSFLRKGIIGDWKNYFNEEACEIFKKYAGDALIKLGYEQNNSWSNAQA